MIKGGRVPGSGFELRFIETQIGALFTAHSETGLAAYFLDRIEDQGHKKRSLTYSQAKKIMFQLEGVFNKYGTLEMSHVEEAFLQAGCHPKTSMSAGNSTGSLSDILKILLGSSYHLPFGSKIRNADESFAKEIQGSFGGSSLMS
jgi:hypothetical protein